MALQTESSAGSFLSENINLTADQSSVLVVLYSLAEAVQYWCEETNSLAMPQYRLNSHCSLCTEFNIFIVLDLRLSRGFPMFQTKPAE